jgi:hypothetical protein
MSKTTACCAICTESYNKSNRKEVKCPTCNFSACRICYTTYWNNSLSGTNSKLRCISGRCDYLFDVMDMINKKTFTLKDIKNLQDLLRSIAIDEEDLHALSAITDEHINKVKEALYCRKMVIDITAEIERRGEPVSYSMNGFLRHVSPGTRFLYHLRKSYKDISSYSRPGGLSHMDKFLSDNQEYVDKYMTPELYSKLVLYDGANLPKEDSVEEVDIPVSNCSMNDCRGFIRTKGFKCNICLTKFCSKCMNEKQDNHQCKEDDVSSFHLIKKDCKACPSCKTLIYKIEGCNDMFCVICKTPFNWRTGRIITGRFHNPHHGEWLASMRNQHPTNEAVDVCDRSRFYRMTIYSSHQSVKGYINHTMHLYNSELPGYETNNDDKVLEQRVMYLIGITAKEAYTDKMKKMKKLLDYKKEICDMIIAYVNIMTNLFDILEQSPNRISQKLKEDAVQKGFPLIQNDQIGYTYEEFFQHAQRFIEDFYTTNSLINKKYDYNRTNLFNEVMGKVNEVNANWLWRDPQLVDVQAWQEMNAKKVKPRNRHPYLQYTDDTYRTMIVELREQGQLSNITSPNLGDQEKAYIQVLYLMDRYQINEYDARNMRRSAKRNGTLKDLLNLPDPEDGE